MVGIAFLRPEIFSLKVRKWVPERPSKLHKLGGMFSNQVKLNEFQQTHQTKCFREKDYL